MYHLVAIVGVGQSMYELARYTSVNNYGTAILLEALIERPVERLVVASSMSVYGEGLYEGPDGSTHSNVERTLDQLRRNDWELRGPMGELLKPVVTPEWKTPSLESLYALSKFDQDRMCLMIGRAYNIPASSTPSNQVTIDKEILVSRSTDESLAFLRQMREEERRRIGERARRRILARQTSAHRAAELEGYVYQVLEKPKPRALRLVPSMAQKG